MNLALIQSNGKEPEYMNVTTHEVTHGGDPDGQRLVSRARGTRSAGHGHVPSSVMYIKKKASEPEPERSVDPIDTALPVEPVDEPKEPIKYSPEIQQAKERVNSYEKNILSGKTSDDIFGKYHLDGAKGADNIGTSATAQTKSTEATQSFLNSKKTDLKNSYNFKPKSNITYGAN